MHLLREMEAYVQLVKRKHFGRAAASLGITASTLSRRIAALENDLEVVLIHRSTRSFALTPHGQIFLEKAEAILEAASRAREDLRGHLTSVSGHLRVGAPFDLAVVLLGPVVAKLCRDHPTVSISLICTEGQPDLKRDSLDLAFVVAHQTRLADSSYSVHQVGSFPRRIFGSKDYLKRNGTPKVPTDLQDHVCIRYLGDFPEKSWELHCERRRRKIAVKGPYECSSVVLAAQVAREHLGLAVLADFLALNATFGAGLVRVLPQWEGTPAFVFAVTAKRVPSLAAQKLIQVSRAEFTKQLTLLAFAHLPS